MDILLHFVVRDRATQGRDFMLWGKQEANEDSADIIDRAMTSLRRALQDGLDVELVVTKSEEY